jgi:uncharacterized repeat protein (TIGR03803 family)
MAIAVLAACAGSQAPMGAAPVAMPQSRTFAVAAHAGRGAMRASSAQYNILYRFKGGAKGEHPESGLVDVDGTLYGTTYQGGSGCHRGCGTVYSLSTSGREKVLWAFRGDSGDGQNPLGDLLDVNGTLYGTTLGGGEGQGGTFYRVSLTGEEKVLFGFAPVGTGYFPAAGVIDVEGTLYGTTRQGCAALPTSFYQCGPESSESWGVVYDVSTTGQEHVLYSFRNGMLPDAPVIDLNGTLYGTTPDGGPHEGGIVYSFSIASGAERVLYGFTGGSDGKSPAAGLLDVNGTLYGTTLHGGGSSTCKSIEHDSTGCGTVFSISTSGAETVLHSFAGGSDGAYPRAALTDVNGTLYGTTAAGGGAPACAYGCGTIFSISTSGAETVVHSFTAGSDGWRPVAGLLDVNGTLYGTTSLGGDRSTGCQQGCGTVFSLAP